MLVTFMMLPAMSAPLSVAGFQEERDKRRHADHAGTHNSKPDQRMVHLGEVLDVTMQPLQVPVMLI